LSLLDRATTRPMRAAVVELQTVHEEVLPAVSSVLRACGVEPTLFLNDRIRRLRGDLFSTIAGFDIHVRYRHVRNRFDRWRLQSEVEDFDLVVVNTFQTDAAASWAIGTGRPILGLVHNPWHFLKSDYCVKAVRTGRAAVMTLAPHATMWLTARDPTVADRVATITDFRWPLPVTERVAEQRQRVTVPGAVNFTIRDHQSLLRALPKVVEALPEGAFEIAVVGAGPDRAALERVVTDAGCAELFTFAPLDPLTRTVSNATYFRELSSSTFVLPLLPDSFNHGRTHKITSAIPTSVGFGIPAVLDRWTADVYQIPNVTYANGEIADGLVRALSMDEPRYADLRAELEAARGESIGDAIKSVNNVLTPLLEPRKRHGRTERLGESASSRDDAAAFHDFVRRVLPTSYAQRFQDLWALWECGFQQSGYFVEFGALGGRDFSNTFLLEQLGWNGVVAEPHPAFEQRLRRNRHCHISTKCVYDESGRRVTFHAVRGRPALSTIAGFGDDDWAHLRADHVAHEVETISLNDLLLESAAPPRIEFMSIDTEGSELRILEAFDFTGFAIACISVEHNDHHREALKSILAEHGYRRKWPEISGHDDWYVMDSLLPDWDPANVAGLISGLVMVKPFMTGLQERFRLLIDLEAHVAGSHTPTTAPAS
jgi:FkbM family methyltransferase